MHEEVGVPANGGVLSGVLFLGNGDSEKKPAALLIHGWQSGQNRMFETAEILSGLGITCLTIDLRGHGKTPGDLNTLSRKDFLADVIAGYDFLVHREDVDSARIGVVGSSFGGYFAALLASKRKLAWMVLRVPADFVDDGFDKAKRADASAIAPLITASTPWKATRALRSIHEFAGNVLLVESGNDDIIPSETIANFRNAVSDPADLTYILMEGAPHSLTRAPEYKKQFNEIVQKWVSANGMV